MRRIFFALIAEDVLYSRSTRRRGLRTKTRGCKAFNPFGKGTMGYYELPEDILEDEDELRTWIATPSSVARRKKK